MVSIGEIRNRIVHDIADCLSELGFTSEKEYTFYALSKVTTHVVKICFLDRRHAASFGSNTASFSLELGVFYTFVPSSRDVARSDTDSDLFPKHYECHFRGNLLRDIPQSEPCRDYAWDEETQVAIKGARKWLASFLKQRYGYRARLSCLWRKRKHSDSRNDIWWVDSSGSNLDEVLNSATRVIRERAKSWLNKFSDLKYAYRYLRWRSGKNSGQGGPFNLGKKGCPGRQYLMRHISMKLNGDIV